MQEHRIQEVRELLRTHLYPGESFRVRWEGPDLELVVEEGREALVQDDNDAYGMLLAINDRIGSAGTILAFAGLGFTVFALLSIAFDWFPNITGSLDDLRAWWFYVLGGVTGLIVTSWMTAHRERRAFRASRRELDEALDRLGISRFALLAMIKDDEDLASLTEMLKSTGAEP